MPKIRFTAPVELQAASGKPPRLSILAYSGGLMTVPGFGPVVVDLAGAELPGSLPVLIDHDATLNGIVGSGRPVVQSGRLVVEGQLAVGAEASAKILDLARSGVAFQASIGAEPLERKPLRAGERIGVNGRTITVPASGAVLIARSRLREVSITALGADPATSVSIAAKMRKDDMDFEQWLTEQGFDPATLTDQQKTTLQAAYHASQQAEPGGPEALDEDAVRREERERLAEIERICAGNWGAQSQNVQTLRAQAVAGELTAEQLRARLLDTLRASRPTRPAIHTAGDHGPSDANHLAAAILVRSGLERAAEQTWGARVLEQSRPLHGASLVDMCRAALLIDGRDVPHNRNEMIRAAVSSGSMSTALGNAANKAIEVAYREANQTWRAFCAVRPAADFKTHTSIRPSFAGGLEQVAPDGDLKHGTLDESTFTWSVDTYGKIYKISRTDIVNDDVGVFAETAPALGTAAARKLADLIYTTLLANAGSFFSAGNGNLLTGAGSALDATSLGDAVEKMRKQVDDDGNDLSIAPKALLVPPELEVTARQLLESAEVNKTGDDSPTGNALRNLASLAVESRLSNTAKFTSGSTTAWYLFAGPADVPMVVGFLDGRQTPTIEFFGLDADPTSLAVTWRVYHDFGCALGDYRAAVKSDGA